jgi:regulator of chromosome condensation
MSNKRNAHDASTSVEDDGAYPHKLHAIKRGRTSDGGTFLGGIAEHRPVDFGEIGGLATPTSSSTSPRPPSRDGSTTGSLVSSSAANARRGRVVRQRQYFDGMLLLNYETYKWAKSLLSKPNEIADDSFYDGVVENYLQRSSELRRRFDRDYGDVVVFGNGECGQLGCGEAVDESRVPRILVGLRGAKIDMIACGGLHSLALMEDGTVYSWGCNDEGSLGWRTSDEEGGNNGYSPNKVLGFVPSAYGPNGRTEDLTEEDGSTVVPFSKRREAVISQVAAGETQSVALSSAGDVYVWGTYKDTEGRKFRSVPPPDDDRTPTGYKDMTMLEEDDEPKWYHPPRGNQDWPCHITSIPGRAKDVSAGAAYNAALLEDGTIVTWGLGQIGELARPVPVLDKKTSNDVIITDFLTPKQPAWDVPKINPKMKRTVVTMSCGGYHLLVVTKEGDGDLEVYSSGLNNYGQLGHGDIDNRNVLTKIQSLSGKDITKVDGGMHFSCFIDKTSKELYACGRGDYGTLGCTLEQPDPGYMVNLPIRVPLVHEPDAQAIADRNINRKENCIIVEDIIEADQPEIKQISCGSTHVLVLTEDGDAYSWGFGESGACGQGRSDQDVFRPTRLVPRLVSKGVGGDALSAACKIQYVSGGGQHSSAIVKTGSTGFSS